MAETESKQSHKSHFTATSPWVPISVYYTDPEEPMRAFFVGLPGWRACQIVMWN